MLQSTRRGSFVAAAFVAFNSFAHTPPAAPAPALLYKPKVLFFKNLLQVANVSNMPRPRSPFAVFRLSAFMAKICELSKSATKIALKLQIMWQEQSNGKWHGKRGRRGSVEEGGGALVNDSHGVQQATQRGCF